ncbi:hypothetical protein JCM3774_003744 [Rhodotorula dairenensis]
MADHLLSILRGTAPAPAAPPTSRPPHESLAPPSLSRHDSATSAGSEARPTTESNGSNGHASAGLPNPLEQLLRTFSQPRPSYGSSPLSSAAAPSLSPSGTEQATTGEPNTAARPAGAPGKDSAALLSLLKGSSTAAMSPPPPNQPLTSPLLSPRGGNAKDLLGLLMGSAPSTPAAEQPPLQEEPLASATSSATTPLPESEAKQGLPPVDVLGLLGIQDAKASPEAVEPAAKSASQPAAAAPSAPVFTFVSPFDFLESTRSPPPPATVSTPQAAQIESGQQQRASDGLSPNQLPTPTDSVGSPGSRDPVGTARREAAFSPTAILTSAAAVAPNASSPVSVMSASEVLSTPSGKATIAAAEGGPSTFPREYLASAYIPSTPAPAPSWAPLGVRLPRRASLPYDAPQHLTISTSDPHREALVPSPPEVTPIALFSVPAEDRRSLARRRTAGIWEHGIAYASAGSGKHRIRVIDRESGAKVLLKGKKDEKEVVDLQVDRSSRDGKRRIACVSNGGTLSVWQVPDRFDNEAEASQQCVFYPWSATRLLHIAGSVPAAPFVLARFVPGQQRLYAVRSDRVISAYYLSQPAAKPRDIRLIGGGEIVDVAFSPDATYAAVLMTQSVVTFQLENSGAQKKTALDEILPPGFEADQVTFVTPAAVPTGAPQGDQARPLGLAISSACGTHISVFPAQSQNGRLSLTATPTVEIEMTPPSEYGQSLFGQMEYHEKTQSLVLSHSLRGSLYTFRLAFVEGPDGEPLIRVNHVLEHPTPDPIISFTLDSLPAADPSSTSKGTDLLPEGVRAASKIRYGALVVHPGGVHHVAIVAEEPRQYAEVAPKHHSHDSDTSSDGEEGGGARRMSLEGSIHVSSEVEVTVEEIQVVELEFEVEEDNAVQGVLIAASVDEPEEAEQLSPAEGTPRVATTAMPAASPPRRAAAEPVLGDLSNGLPAAATPIAELSSAEASPIPGLADVKLSGPLVNAAIRNMKATRSGSPAASTSAPLGPAPTGSAQRSAPNDLARFEQALPAKIAQIVQQELHKTGGSSDDLEAKLANLERRLTTTLASVVQRQTAAVVMTTIQQVLPIELSRHLTHPDLVLTLSEVVASNIAPMLEQSLASQVVSAVLPRLDRQLSSAVEGVIDSIRQEMLDVRKEIVQEQSGAVSIPEDEVANLREEVSTMKAMLEKMERLLMASAAAAATTNATSPRIGHAPLQPTSSKQATMRHAPQPAVANQANMFAPPQHAAAASAAPAAAVLVHTLPPIPRAVTPPARYEELFTDVMLPSHEPEFVGLAQLIMSSPLSRLEAIFPPAPAVPSLTMPVVLSLAYRLSQLIANKDGPVDDADKRHLLWLRKAIAACDGKQSPEIVALVPRILQNVVDNLVVRGRRLMAMNDQAGAGEVRLVTQYAHARLTLFLQAGAEGPGVETFRR